jgi:starch synthase
MQKQKILFITHEMTPYLESGEMAHITRELPQQMQENGMEVRVFMPRFGMIKERKHRLHEVIRLSGINIPVGNDDNPLIIKVASLPSAKMQIYFLDNEDFFNKRNYFEDDNGKFYADNDERMIFFNKGVIEIILKLGWIPDIVHCHGWLCSLVPMYARTVHKNESVFKNTKFIYTVYENGFTETLGKEFINKATVTGQPLESFKYLDDPKCNDLYMTGVTFADGIVIGTQETDGDLMNFILEADKPVLPFQQFGTDNFVENHYEFYNSLLDQEILEAKK